MTHTEMERPASFVDLEVFGDAFGEVFAGVPVVASVVVPVEPAFAMLVAASPGLADMVAVQIVVAFFAAQVAGKAVAAFFAVAFFVVGHVFVRLAFDHGRFAVGSFAVFAFVLFAFGLVAAGSVAVAP